MRKLLKVTNRQIQLFIINYQLYSGGYSAGVPPLPIPNREVKPNYVDGTAQKVGE